MPDFNISVSASELNNAITKANAAAPQSTTFTKSETNTLLAGKADLIDGKVPAAQLPSYVDDVVEYASTSVFPETGESGKIYIATDTNKTYRWGGSAYVEISESLALGETASTAYAGDKGKANADAITKKPGEITTGKQYVIDGQTVPAGTGAEVFNDLSGNKASGAQSHAEGLGTTASGPSSHAEGAGTKASGGQSHAEGGGTKASGGQSHAEGSGTNASGTVSHAEGGGTTASGPNSHAEGGSTEASGQSSHAEGGSTEASGQSSHAEGQGTTASGQFSHAEGAGTKASGVQSHAEGGGTNASGTVSHAEGGGTTASGVQSHAEGGGTTASGAQSHAEGSGTKASSTNQHVQGKYNAEDANDTYAFIIGNGTADNARHNAFAIDWNGLIYVNGAATGVNVATLATDLAALTARVEALENQ